MSPQIATFLLVGLGGFCGAIVRFATSSWVHRALPSGATFPLGTLTVNLIGCLLIGVLSGLAEHHQMLRPEHRLFFIVGVLGSFTTFSTFAFETFSLAQSAEIAKALANVVLQVVLGFLAAWLGHTAVRLL